MKLDYIAKAEQADEYASHATDTVEKKFWQRTANHYRRLAVFVQPSSRSRAWRGKIQSGFQGQPKH